MKVWKHQFLFYGAVVFLFNALFFIFIGEFSPSRWICYAAWHVLLGAVVFTVNASDNNGSVVHSYPLLFINGVGFCVGTLLALVFIVVNPESIKLPLVFFLLIIITELVAIAVIGGVKSLCDQNDAALSGFRRFRLESKKRVELALLHTRDAEVCSALDKLLRALSNAQLESSPAAKNVEEQISEGITELESYLQTNKKLAQEKCDNLIQLVQTRDSILSHSR